MGCFQHDMTHLKLHLPSASRQRKCVRIMGTCYGEREAYCFATGLRVRLEAEDEVEGGDVGDDDESLPLDDDDDSCRSSCLAPTAGEAFFEIVSAVRHTVVALSPWGLHTTSPSFRSKAGTEYFVRTAPTRGERGIVVGGGQDMTGHGPRPPGLLPFQWAPIRACQSSSPGGWP